jgi:MFS family permease
MAVSMSAIFIGSFPVFLAPVSADLGWGRATFPQMIAIVSITAALCMPFAGRLIDRIGVRWPVTIGLLLTAAGMALLSLLRDAGLVFWASALCLGVGASLSGPPAYIGLVSSWYDRNRALALGFILSVAPACSQATVASLSQRLIDHFEWRPSFLVLAALVAAIGLPTALGFLRPRPLAADERTRPIPIGASGREALRSGTFWLLSAASCLASGSVIGLSVHVVAWLTGRGVPAGTAAFVMSVLYLAGMAGAFLTGLVADRTRRVAALQVFYAAPVAGLGLMAFSTDLAPLLAGATLIGIGMSSATTITPFLVTRYFGLKASGEIFAIVLSMTMVAIGIAPVLIGAGYDLSGSYSMPLIGAAMTIGLSVLCIGLIERQRAPVSAQAVHSSDAPATEARG